MSDNINQECGVCGHSIEAHSKPIPYKYSEGDYSHSEYDIDYGCTLCDCVSYCDERAEDGGLL